MMIRTFGQLTIAASISLGVLGAFVGGCGGPDKPADAANVPGGPGADAGPTGLASLTTESASAANGITAAAAKAPAMALQQAGSPTGDAVETGLRTAAATGAPGMAPDGPMGRADLKQGGHATMNVTLRAGHCYAIVGFGSGVTDLDLHVLTPPNYDVVAYEDSTDDNAPIAGKAPHAICPASAVDLPYKVDAFAETGAGSIGVQLYSKTQ